MPVDHLGARRNAKKQDFLQRLRGMLQGVAVPPGAEKCLSHLLDFLDRELSAERHWTFTMVETTLFDEVATYLAAHSKRPKKALLLWCKLFRFLPSDSNEVQASRDELARLLNVKPQDISEIISEMEEIGAVYRRPDGRGVRYYVNPLLGTHLSGRIRDRAQDEAPELRIPAAAG